MGGVLSNLFNLNHFSPETHGFGSSPILIHFKDFKNKPHIFNHYHKNNPIDSTKFWALQ